MVRWFQNRSSGACEFGTFTIDSADFKTASEQLTVVRDADNKHSGVTTALLCVLTFIRTVSRDD